MGIRNIDGLTDDKEDDTLQKCEIWGS